MPQNDTQAVQWYRRAAEQGDAQAQHDLGFMYDLGRGVPQDYEQAVKWYRHAAQQGDTQAQNNLGVMYENGHGVSQDRVQAYKWYELAVSQLSQSKYRERAIQNREALKSQMAQSEIEKAQQLAREWEPRSAQVSDPAKAQ